MKCFEYNILGTKNWKFSHSWSVVNLVVGAVGVNLVILLAHVVLVHVYDVVGV